MKISKKLVIAIVLVMTITYILSGLFNKAYAAYNLYGWNTGKDSNGRKYSTYYYGKNSWGTQYDWRIRWSSSSCLGKNDYAMHCNFACFVFNNIYCIQPGYAYENDYFNINYGIEIDGLEATLYKGGWSNAIGTWSCEENNIMAGIINYSGSNGIRIDGDYKSGDKSAIQIGINAYWNTFEKAMNNGLGTSYDWRIC